MQLLQGPGSFLKVPAGSRCSEPKYTNLCKERFDRIRALEADFWCGAPNITINRFILPTTVSLVLGAARCAQGTTHICSFWERAAFSGLASSRRKEGVWNAAGVLHMAKPRVVSGGHHWSELKWDFPLGRLPRDHLLVKVGLKFRWFSSFGHHEDVH